MLYSMIFCAYNNNIFKQEVTFCFAQLQSVNLKHYNIIVALTPPPLVGQLFNNYSKLRTERIRRVP